ncbi:Ger(x)C family spore germination protein [Sutcliffiella deserti]|uniref:Ger(x)C family spore germination protein n=1 Tax=Sutcliffiella deserti TaxID=2875501 RepID=UPI001CBCED9E|nr:Ger(x)C family spore germination protein [Sutcliffiella deserti]
MPQCKWLVILCCCLLLTGCLEKEIVDDINIESAEGFDLVEGEKVRGTFLIPIYQADKSITNKTFSSVANMNKDLLANLQKESSAPIVNGSLQVVIFNKKLAEKGMMELIDALERDSSIGTSLYLAVLEGEVKSVLEKEYGTEGTGHYIMNLIKHNVHRRDLPASNLHIFLSDHYQEGKDPNLPYLKEENDDIAIQGAVVIKDNKLVAVVPNDMLFYFKLLVDKHSGGTLSIMIPDENEHVSLKSIKTDSQVKVEWKNGEPHFHIELKMNGTIREYSGTKVNGKQIEIFQKAFEEELKKQSLALIKLFQEKNVDPIGLGFEAKSRKRGFDLKKWEKTYPNVEVNVTTEVTILGTGITE